MSHYNEIICLELAYSSIFLFKVSMTRDLDSDHTNYSIQFIISHMGFKIDFKFNRPLPRNSERELRWAAILLIGFGFFFPCPCFLACTIYVSAMAGILCQSPDLGLVDFRGFCPCCGPVFRDQSVYPSVLFVTRIRASKSDLPGSHITAPRFPLSLSLFFFGLLNYFVRTKIIY